jgi:hypothetical protein
MLVALQVGDRIERQFGFLVQIVRPPNALDSQEIRVSVNPELGKF